MSEVLALLDVLKPVALAMTFGGGLALSDKLANAQEAIRRHSSQKAVAIDARIPESRLAAKLRGTQDAVLNLRDLDKMPVPVQQTFHFLEIARLGLPVEVRRAVKMARAIKRVQHRRSA